MGFRRKRKEYIMDSDETIDTACGYTKSCKPSFMQRCATVQVYLAVLTTFGLIKGFAINGINNISTLMYERRYQLSSSESSLVSVLQDVSTGICVIAVGYFGTKGHKPRIIAISIVVMGVGTFVMCLAQFAAPPYEPSGFATADNQNDTGICMAASNDDGGEKGESLKQFLVLLVLGQVLNGYCSACIYSLGLTFLELSSPSAVSGLYFGIFSSAVVFGPAVGFLGGSQLLDIYVDFPKDPPPGLTPSDPAWVGAWWLGFLITCILCVVFALLMFLFPRELPATAAISAAKVCEAHDNGTEQKVADMGFGTSCWQLPKATWYLFKNPVYMCISVVDAIELGITVGIATFASKVLVVQFYIDPSFAAIVGGAIAIPAAVLGQLGSGIIIKQLNMTLSQMIKLALASSIIAACFAPVFITTCGEVVYAGVNTEYLSSEPLETYNLNSTCNAGCGCNTAGYDPVCSNGVQYFSPCHAGCTKAPLTIKDEDDNKLRVYQDCSCPLQLNSSSVNATQGVCKDKCKLLYPVFVPGLFILLLGIFFMGTPMTLSSLRVVPSNLRTYGMAIHGLLLRLMGGIPVPLLFGAMIDASCVIWQEKNGVKGTCWVYDHKELGLRITLLLVFLKAISIAFHILSLILYKPPPTDSEASSLDEKSSDKFDSKDEPLDKNGLKDTEMDGQDNPTYTDDEVKGGISF